LHALDSWKKILLLFKEMAVLKNIVDFITMLIGAESEASGAQINRQV
jgi:hypothetical protein